MYKRAQISFIIALFLRGIGFTTNSILISKKITLGTISMFTSGLPGYMTVVAYTMIFFSWCTVCYEVLSNDSKTFFQKSQRVLTWILICLAICFVIAMIIFCSANNVYGHKTEAMIATVRDIVLGCFYASYLYEIQTLFKTSICDFSKPEIKLYILCSILAFALFYRSISIQIYTWYYSYNRDCTKKYLVNLIIDMILDEIIPVLAIGLVRFCGIIQPIKSRSEISISTPLDDI